MANPWEEYAPQSGPWQDYAQPVNQAPAQNGLLQTLGNFGAGAIRGAGSIGATLLTPIDAAARAIGVQNDYVGRNDRREAMTGALKEMGVDPNSLAFQGGKIGAEIAGTLPVGGALAKGASMIPGAAKGMPALIEALRTSGMAGGNAATRITGGAITGGATAGLVNPDSASMGALVGGAIPAMGSAYSGVKNAMTNAPSLTPEKLQTLKDAMDLGFKVPPSQANPSWANRTLESMAGKAETQQMASLNNDAVRDSIIRKTLPGLAPDSPMSKEAMQAYRNLQFQSGYEPLKQAGMIEAGAPFNQALNKLAEPLTPSTIPAVAQANQPLVDLIKQHESQGFDAGDAVNAIQSLRKQASDAFSRGDGQAGTVMRDIAKNYENAIENGLSKNSLEGTSNNLLQGFKDARQNMAKSYAIENAIKDGSGEVDPRKLANALQKGDPLSDDLRVAAQFANVFPKANQFSGTVGSPGVNNLKAYMTGGAGTAGAGMGAMLGGPVGAAIGGGLGAVAPQVASPIARSIMFSPKFQQGLLEQDDPEISALVQALRQGVYKTAPVLSAQ